MKVSLTGATSWLRRLGQLPPRYWQDGAEGVARLPDPAPAELMVTATPNGMIEHPLPIVQYSQTPGFWAIPPEPAGASDAVWNEPATPC